LYNLDTGSAKQIFDEIRFNIREIAWARDGRGFSPPQLQRNPQYLWGQLPSCTTTISLPTHRTKIDLGWEMVCPVGFEVTNSGVIVFLANGARNKAALFIRDGDTWRREFLTGTHVENIYGIKLGNDNKTLFITIPRPAPRRNGIARCWMERIFSRRSR